jgi:hypothetical protein
MMVDAANRHAIAKTQRRAFPGILIRLPLGKRDCTLSRQLYDWNAGNSDPDFLHFVAANHAIRQNAGAELLLEFEEWENS